MSSCPKYNGSTSLKPILDIIFSGVAVISKDLGMTPIEVIDGIRAIIHKREHNE